MLLNTSRIEKNEQGIRFYQQDILYSSYLFNGDLTIDMVVDYLRPGFGIVLSENNGKPMGQEDNMYLFKIGSNDFRVIHKYIYEQKEVHTASCTLSASKAQTKLHLIFTLKSGMVSYDYMLPGTNRKINIGSYKMSRAFEEYLVGFYSNANNTIRSISYVSGVPDDWNINISNAFGGRIAFFEDGFKIESCKYNAELEQDNIELKAGTYYVAFNRENINNEHDISCYLFPSYANSISDSNFEDSKKSILKNDMSFTIEQDTKVSLKFVGRNGIIKNICIKDKSMSSFVETDKEGPLHLEGSYLSINLKDINKMSWRGTIQQLPETMDEYDTSYHIVSQGRTIIREDEAGIRLNKDFYYTFTVATGILEIRDNLGAVLSRNVFPDSQDPLIIFKNIKGFIDEFIVYDKSNHPNNAIVQNIFRKYVQSPVAGPIIVYQKDKRNEPFDLSAAYREVVEPHETLEIFSLQQALILKESVFIDPNKIKVYGIPKGTIIHPGAVSINELAINYVEIPKSSWSRTGSHIEMDTVLRKEYIYIVVAYSSSDNYTYMFTTYEREVYDKNDEIVLEKQPLENDGSFIIYGVLPEAHIDTDNMYRVENILSMNSIDLYCDAYDVIPPESYDVDYANMSIKISTDVRTKYKQFVLDYLKKDSYAINYVDSIDEYAIDISTDATTVTLEYDTNETQDIKHYKVTSITPDKKKYIAIKKVGAE